MTTTEGSEVPAFPTTGQGVSDGLTARQYAAIQLKVPDSGTPWLDAMIRRARRDEAAKEAMKGLLANPIFYEKAGEAVKKTSRVNFDEMLCRVVVNISQDYADALIAEGENGAK